MAFLHYTKYITKHIEQDKKLKTYALFKKIFGVVSWNCALVHIICVSKQAGMAQKRPHVIRNIIIEHPPQWWTYSIVMNILHSTRNMTTLFESGTTTAAMIKWNRTVGFYTLNILNRYESNLLKGFFVCKWYQTELKLLRKAERCCNIA